MVRSDCLNCSSVARLSTDAGAAPFGVASSVILLCSGCTLTSHPLFRWRGLFVKLVLTFFLVCLAALVIVGSLDVYLSSPRFERDARDLLGTLDTSSLELPSNADARGDTDRCRAFADALFRQVIERGTAQVADFGAILSYFYTGRLQVQIVDGARVQCASTPAPTPLLGETLAQALGSGTRETMQRQGREWALASRMALPSGEQALVGVHFFPGWGTSHVIGYDLLRTLAFVGAQGISFIIVIVWFVLRRIRRATRAADRWAAGDFSARIVDGSRDEFSALAERFNHMADALAQTIEVDKALAVSVERNRIGRDLHDTAKQRSFVLGLKLTELEHDARSHGELLTTIADARRLLDHLQQDLVRAVSGFNPPVITEWGLRDALSRSLSDLLSGSCIEWSLDLAPDIEHVLLSAAPVAQELLAITHEAVANARRHSGCSRICVSAQGRARLAWIIEDNGKGFDPALPTHGMGLTNLQWRASSLPDGALAVASSAAGTRVAVSFNLPGASNP